MDVQSRTQYKGNNKINPAEHTTKTKSNYSYRTGVKHVRAILYWYNNQELINIIVGSKSNHNIGSHFDSKILYGNPNRYYI